MSWKHAWQYRRRVFMETVSTPTFWWTLIGVVGALVVWFYLFYLAVKLIDTSLAMHSTFCATDQQRNIHIMALVLLTPLFLVGMIGVISEWMTIMDNRKKKWKSSYKPLVVFSVMMQLAALFILIAFQC